MSMKLSAGEVVRQDEFLIDPSEVIVDPMLNGRWKPHDDEAVEVLARSIGDEGQLQAVQVRRIDGNRVQLVLGYRRHAAVKLHNYHNPENQIKLRCKVVVISPEEAFRRNIVENRQRSDCTPIDDAHNQRRLREVHGWQDVKIAEFYGMTPSYVSRLRKLLSLPDKVQDAVHGKSLSVDAALALADLPQKDREEVLATDLNGHVTTEEAPAVEPPVKTSQEIVAAVRDKKIDQGTGKGQPRTLKEVRAFLEGLTGPAEPKAVKDLAEAFLKFLQGKIKDAAMEKHFRKIAEAL
jgi:ParB/RepB/Spo0J family partition protein